MKRFMFALLIVGFALVASPRARAEDRGIYANINLVIESGRLTSDFNWQDARKISKFMGLVTAQQILKSDGYEFLRWLPYRTYMWNDGTHVVVLYVEYDHIEEVHTLNIGSGREKPVIQDIPATLR